MSKRKNSIKKKTCYHTPINLIDIKTGIVSMDKACNELTVLYNREKNDENKTMLRKVEQVRMKSIAPWGWQISNAEDRAAIAIGALAGDKPKEFCDFYLSEFFDYLC